MAAVWIPAVSAASYHLWTLLHDGSDACLSLVLLLILALLTGLAGCSTQAWCCLVLHELHSFHVRPRCMPQNKVVVLVHFLGS